MIYSRQHITDGTGFAPGTRFLAVDQPQPTPEGVTFTPWTDGTAVGFRVTRAQDERVEYVILNPSSGQDGADSDGRGDVFVYHAAYADGVEEASGDPIDGGSPVVYVPVFEGPPVRPWCPHDGDVRAVRTGSVIVRYCQLCGGVL